MSHVHDLPLDQSPKSATDTTFAYSLASISAGLEVVPPSDKQTQQSEKETVQPLPEAISHADKEVYHNWATGHGHVVAAQDAEERITKRRICGLSRRFFWIFIATLVVALALIVGLGGGLGARRSRTAASCDSCMYLSASIEDLG